MMKLNKMVQTLQNEVIVNEFIKHWQHDADSLHFWRASSNFIFQFSDHKQIRYLRFMYEDGNRLERLQTELAFIQYLDSQGYPVAKPVATRSGALIATEQVDGEAYYAVAFEAAPGQQLELAALNHDQLAEWGRSLARLHQLSEQYEQTQQPTDATDTKDAFPASRSWTNLLTHMEEVLNRHPKEIARRALLAKMTDELHELHALPSSQSEMGWIHYDFQPDNLFYDEKKTILTAIDFDDSMYHWYAMDVVAALADVWEEKGSQAQQQYQQFLAGYQEIRRISKDVLNKKELFQQFHSLYQAVRILESLEDFDPQAAPEWSKQLYERLQDMLDNSRPTPTLSFGGIHADNWYDCSQLTATKEQQEHFPVPSVYWLAEAAYCGFTPLAIYAENELIGMTVYSVDPADSSYWIMSFLIDQRFQQAGLGKQALHELVQYMIGKHQCDAIYLGHRPGNEVAAKLYQAAGFIAIDKTEQEVIRRLQA